MDKLEQAVFDLASASYKSKGRVSLIHTKHSLQIISRENGMPLCTYYGEITIPLRQSTKEERLQQALKDLRIRIHNRITELKGALNQSSMVDCKGAD